MEVRKEELTKRKRKRKIEIDFLILNEHGNYMQDWYIMLSLCIVYYYNECPINDDLYDLYIKNSIHSLFNI